MLKSAKPRTLLLLAAGLLLGWVAAAGIFPLGRPASAATVEGLTGVPSVLAARVIRAQGEGAEVIVMTVRLPADAILLIDDHKTQATGDVRTFRTPPLPAGGHFAYTLKATSQGKEVTRKIHIAHGVDNTFDLRAEFLAVAKVTVHPRHFTASGTEEMPDLYITVIWGASLRTVEQALEKQPPDGSRFPK